jgi:outer membrane protein OmpA-like peptidoglycan-associated protein
MLIEIDWESGMKFNLGAASLVALALFVGQGFAEDNAVTTEQPVVEQPAAPAAEQPAAPAVEVAPAPAVEVAPAPPAIPEGVLALLSDTRAPAELSIDELKSRAKKARKFSQDESLPEDLRGQLAALSQGASDELSAREQAAKAAEPPPPPPKLEEPAPQPVQEAAPVAKPEEPAAAVVAPAPAPAPIPDEVNALLTDNRNPADLSAEDLQARAKEARRFSKDENLPSDVRDQLKQIAQASRDELAAREKQVQDQKPAEPQPQAQPAPVIAEPAPAPAPEPAPAIIQAAPAASAAEEAKPVEPVAPPPPSAADAKTLDSNAGDPAAEKQARAYLDDTTALDSLSDDDLRARLDGIREVMSSNELSRDTERAVRQKLKAEREVLRQRLAAKEDAMKAKQAQEAAAAPAPAVVAPPPAPDAKPEPAALALPPLPPAPPPPPPLPPVVTTTNNTVVNNTTINNVVIINNTTPVAVVLRDQRPPEELQMVELQRRVQVYNDAQFDEDYDQEYRDYWRASIARDREILRRRMIEERRRRANQLSLNFGNNNLDIQINIDLTPNRPRPQRDVFAAEVDDAELEEVLVAPPRRKYDRPYKLEEIAVQPRLRESVNRIEIDTIRFGSNEGFVREEQLQSLDGIAAIIERIVKKYPNEVFLIEGHTDAPGSAVYNAKLSKLRAEAIKRALVSYYVIPARNLRTVGLGERFLKIPTSDAEPENRRVSISRITQLLGRN